jgi:hypothetical protein
VHNEIKKTTLIESSLGNMLPLELRQKYQGHSKFIALSQKEIEKIVNFHPPFLRTEKMLIFGESLVGSSSIGIGTVRQEDVEGHYNKTIYLALAGRLMPSTATIHIAYFHPNTSPQAIEGKSIRMEKNAFNGGLIQPKKEGSTFFVETVVVKKKLNLILVETRIMFGSAKFGLIENLKFMLTEKDSIYKAVTVPDVT